MLEIRPITFREASDFINKNHRHHSATVGCKFCIGVYKDGSMVGCAVCGRPVSRILDDGFTCEVNRLCTDGTKNACSKLYSACSRIAKDMGYKRIITYILEDEPGTSLKASGFEFQGITHVNRSWNCKSRPRKTKSPTVSKKRYGKDL